MSKFVKSMICALGVCSLFFVGCSKSVANNTSSKTENSQSTTEDSSGNINSSSDNVDNNDEVSSENNIESTSNSSNDNSNKNQSLDSSSNEYNSESTQNTEVSQDAESQKQFYLNKLDELAKNLEETRDERYAGPTTLDLIEAANEEYKQWDDVLNEIYSVLEQQLSQEDMDKLRVEEIQWINTKESQSKEAADKYKGGTIAPYMAISSQIGSTKDRCYELVNQYMN
jgi:uncharacterized protein YecT (DUF1311 family)